MHGLPLVPLEAGPCTRSDSKSIPSPCPVDSALSLEVLAPPPHPAAGPESFATLLPLLLIPPEELEREGSSAAIEVPALEVGSSTEVASTATSPTSATTSSTTFATSDGTSATVLYGALGISDPRDPPATTVASWGMRKNGVLEPHHPDVEWEREEGATAGGKPLPPPDCADLLLDPLVAVSLLVPGPSEALARRPSFRDTSHTFLPTPSGEVDMLALGTDRHAARCERQVASPVIIAPSTLAAEEELYAPELPSHASAATADPDSRYTLRRRYALRLATRRRVSAPSRPTSLGEPGDGNAGPLDADVGLGDGDGPDAERDEKEVEGNHDPQAWGEERLAPLDMGPTAIQPATRGARSPGVAWQLRPRRASRRPASYPSAASGLQLEYGGVPAVAPVVSKPPSISSPSSWLSFLRPGAGSPLRLRLAKARSGPPTIPTIRPDQELELFLQSQDKLLHGHYPLHDQLLITNLLWNLREDARVTLVPDRRLARRTFLPRRTSPRRRALLAMLARRRGMEAEEGTEEEGVVNLLPGIARSGPFSLASSMSSSPMPSVLPKSSLKLEVLRPRFEEGSDVALPPATAPSVRSLFLATLASKLKHGWRRDGAEPHSPAREASRERAARTAIVTTEAEEEQDEEDDLPLFRLHPGSSTPARTGA